MYKYSDDPSFDLVRKRVTYLFERFCESNGLSAIVMDIDRSGAQEWTAFHEDTMHRYLSTFLTFIGNEGDRAPILLEFWYTVDNSRRYVRRRVGPGRRVSSYYFHSTTSQLPFKLRELWHAAQRVRDEELTEPILMPIYGEWPEAVNVPPHTS
jgi:hypothetical protein